MAQQAYGKGLARRDTTVLSHVTGEKKSLYLIMCCRIPWNLCVRDDEGDATKVCFFMSMQLNGDKTKRIESGQSKKGGNNECLTNSRFLVPVHLILLTAILHLTPSNTFYLYYLFYFIKSAQHQTAYEHQYDYQRRLYEEESIRKAAQES